MGPEYEKLSRTSLTTARVVDCGLKESKEERTRLSTSCTCLMADGTLILNTKINIIHLGLPIRDNPIGSPGPIAEPRCPYLAPHRRKPASSFFHSRPTDGSRHTLTAHFPRIFQPIIIFPARLHTRFDASRARLSLYDLMVICSFVVSIMKGMRKRGRLCYVCFRSSIICMASKHQPHALFS